MSVKDRFNFAAPTSIIFGEGVLAEIGDYVRQLGARRALVVTTPRMLLRPAGQHMLKSLDNAEIPAETFTEVTPDPPIEQAEACADVLKRSKADIVIGLGGGSVMDVAKTAALLRTHTGSIHEYFGIGRLEFSPLPTILAPTTAGTGSEVSPDAVLVDRDAGTKKAVKDRRIIPSAAFVDTEATWTLPDREAAISGVDALTHAIEAFVSRQASTMSDLMAKEALRLVSAHLLEAVSADGEAKRHARERLALGSLLAGLAFGNAGTAAVHACAYPLSGMFGIPHGMANGLMLSSVTRFNLGSTKKYAQIASILSVDVEALPEKLRSLVSSVGLPTTLSEVGVQSDSVLRMAQVVVPDTRHLSVNPRTMDIYDIQHVFREAL